METRKKIVWIIVFCLLLSACSNTPDEVVSRNTQIVATENQIGTETAAAMPPTETIAPPTATMEQHFTLTPITLPTKLRYEQTATTAPVIVNRPAATAVLGASLISYSPASNTAVNPKQVFNLSIRLKNTSNVTWTKSYRLIHVGGTQMSYEKIYSLTADVAPGGEYTAVVYMTAPEKFGNYTQSWYLADANGVSIVTLSYNLIVGSGTNLTSIPTMTGTVTGTPKGTKMSQLDYMCSDPARSIQQGQGCEEFCKSVKPYDPKCYFHGTLNPTRTLTPIPPTATPTLDYAATNAAATANAAAQTQQAINATNAAAAQTLEAINATNVAAAMTQQAVDATNAAAAQTQQAIIDATNAAAILTQQAPPTSTPEPPAPEPIEPSEEPAP